MTSALLRAHRSDLIQLTGLAQRDLAVMWRKMDLSKPERVRDRLLNVLPQLVTMYGSAAATLGADYYDESRAAARVKGKRYSAITADLPDEEAAAVLARWSVGPLFSNEPNPATALSYLEGGLQMLVADVDRESFMQSSVDDSASAGWQRVASDGACEFCEFLASRGVVYTEASADFASHNHCFCTCVSAWNGQPKPVKEFAPSAKESTPESRARLREYMKTHNGRAAASPASPGARATKPKVAPDTANRLPGAQTAERAASIERQLATYEKQLTDGRGGDWMRDQVKKLRKEQAGLRVL